MKLYENTYENINDFIYLRIKKSGMSTDELGEKIGISGRSVRNKLEHVYEWKLSEIVKLAGIFDVEPSEILELPF